MTVDDERLDELFALPVERFTDERTALVKELKSAGDREDAAMVQSLRKPTVAAWAVNQLVRTRASDVQKLLETGARLREAQQKALSGGGARELQEAGARRRELVDHLVEAAGKLLESGGYSAARARLDEVANTLLATATDDAAAAAVRRGRLEKELPPPAGFGDFGELATVIPMPSRPKAKSARAEGTPGRGAKAKVESAAEAISLALEETAAARTAAL